MVFQSWKSKQPSVSGCPHAAHRLGVPRGVHLSPGCCGSSGRAAFSSRKKWAVGLRIRPRECGSLVAGRPLLGTLVSLGSWLPADTLLGKILGVISKHPCLNISCVCSFAFLRDKSFPKVWAGWGQPGMVNPGNI